MIILLPFPDPRLSPNKRLCWQAKQKAKLAQREAGYVAGVSGSKHRGKIKNNFIPISIDFIPPDNKHRDLDNLLANSKALLDGVAKGLGINDRQFRPITIDVGVPDKKNPRTELEILA